MEIKNMVLGYTERNKKGCRVLRKVYKEFCNRYSRVVVTDGFNIRKTIGVATNFKLLKNIFIGDIDLFDITNVNNKIFRWGIRINKANYLKNKKDYNINSGILEVIGMVDKKNDAY